MTTHTVTSFPAFAGRLFWMIVGPFALATLAISIAGRADGWLSPSDLIYLAGLWCISETRWWWINRGL